MRVSKAGIEKMLKEGMIILYNQDKTSKKFYQVARDGSCIVNLFHNEELFKTKRYDKELIVRLLSRDNKKYKSIETREDKWYKQQYTVLTLA